MNRLEIRDEVERDIFDAALWYEQEVERILERMIDNPMQFPVMERGVRRAQMGIFPYAVFFRFEDEVLTVLGVLHLHRHPSTWKRRV